MKHRALIILSSLAALFGCKTKVVVKGIFGGDVAFLNKHTDTIVLTDETDSAMIVLSAAYQGRVMTSTANGVKGTSFGWINYDLIASGQFQEHINVFGGEDRFWLGPEGGQYSIFFGKDAPFDMEHWFTPAVIDTEPFEVVSKSARQVTFTKSAKLTNYSGTVLSFRMDRKVSLLSRTIAGEKLGLALPDAVSVVAYESDNKITNTGEKAWQKETGLLSIWILGMFKPSPKTTIVIPFKAGSDDELGPKVNDSYFGKVPAERLVVEDDVMFFRGDGRYRSKVGINPQRAKDIAGSYDAAGKVLTLIQYTKGVGVTDYVNSMWELQEKPYAGDVVNSYNDGPAVPGEKPLGPFYELESSSPAAELKPAESISHVHRTFHLQGSEAQLDAIAQKTLGVGITKIKSSLKKCS